MDLFGRGREKFRYLLTMGVSGALRGEMVLVPVISIAMCTYDPNNAVYLIAIFGVNCFFQGMMLSIFQSMTTARLLAFRRNRRAKNAHSEA
ncbi:hypothetical protein [Gluconobacter sp. OJB]|uniref:hypothetical protein n=1 Tax=Gluconobacter sp. OJB TaxID=3145196 RepID=UPI0031F781A4